MGKLALFFIRNFVDNLLLWHVTIVCISSDKFFLPFFFNSIFIYIICIIYYTLHIMYCISYVIYYIYYIRIVLHYTYSPQRNNESVEKFITLLSYKLTFHKALQLICKSLIIRHHYIAFLLIKNLHLIFGEEHHYCWQKKMNRTKSITVSLIFLLDRYSDSMFFSSTLILYFGDKIKNLVWLSLNFLSFYLPL